MQDMPTVSNTYAGYAKNTGYSGRHTNNIRHQYQTCQDYQTLIGTQQQCLTLMRNMLTMSDIELDMPIISDTYVGYTNNA